jgi:hypothetical protein
MGHPLFDQQFYRLAAGWRENTAKAASEYAYFVYQIHERQSDLETSLYFDSAWYCANYTSAAQAIAAGESCVHCTTIFATTVQSHSTHWLNSRKPTTSTAIRMSLTQ